MARNNSLTKLATVIDVLEPKPDSLRGKVVCITGHMGKPRHDVEELIRRAGGETSSDVAWNTNLLVSNQDWSAGTIGSKKKSSKQLKAERRGIRVISEKELYDMMEAGGANLPASDIF
jgi:DNA ligase (NAD+)